MSSRTFTVSGMTCDHCVASVTEEVTEIPGVAAVKVDLESGRLEVDAPDTVTDQAITAAVDEAGYSATAS